MIIAIRGRKGSGKDTFAKILAENTAASIVAFADPMKRFCQYVFDWCEYQLWGASYHREEVDRRYNADDAWATAAGRLLERSPQMVALFTDRDVAHRALHGWFTDLMAEQGRLSPRRALQSLGTEFGRALDEDVWVNYTLAQIGDHEQRLVIIPDCRFPNEIRKVRKKGGVIVYIDRPGIIAVDTHVSENALEQDNDWPDYFVQNYGEVADLVPFARDLLDRLGTR